MPTVALHTDKFDRVVRSVTKMAGLPDAPRVVRAAAGDGQDARRSLRAYVDGNDPITGRPVMQEIVEALTSGAGRRSCRLS